MKCFDDSTPIPQAEEQIELAQWLNEEQVEEKIKKTYSTIADVVDAGVMGMHVL